MVCVGVAQGMGWAEIVEGAVKYEALELVEERWSADANNKGYRVQWVGYGADADTWEREDGLPCGRNHMEFWKDRRIDKLNQSISSGPAQ
jgi:hypothetical protein